MNYLVVDDNPHIVEDLICELGRIDPDAVCHPFLDSLEAHQFALSAPPGSIHVALLDIEMPKMSGLQLAKALTRRFPLVNIIFVTAYGQYALEAYRVYASGFLLKPISGRKLRSELTHLRHPVLTDHHFNPQIAGERIERYRTRAGMTRKDLADAMSVTVQTVGRWELGTRIPDVSTMARLAQVLGVNLETLVIISSKGIRSDLP